MLAGFCLGCAAQENVRLHAEEGWRIPGLSRILAAKPEKEETLDAGGAALRARTFRTGEAGSYRVLFLSRKDDTNYVQWLSIAPRRITAYSYRGRLVSVMVDGVVRLAADPKSGEGGSGGEVQLFYEDEDGSGKFQLMIQNPRFDFRPGVPGWALGK